MLPPLNILFVENDEVDQWAMERFVRAQSLPYKLHIVNTIEDARACLRKDQFDLILLDYALDTGCGLDLMEHTGRVPVIFVSGSGTLETAVEALRMGASDYLIKDPERKYLPLLPPTIQKVLERKKAESEVIRYRAHLENLVEQRTREISSINEKLKIFMTAIDQSPTSVMITDNQGFIEYVNPIFTDAMGYTLDEIRGLTPRCLKSGKHPPQFYENLWKTILAGKIWRGEFCNRKKCGDLIWEMQSIVPLKNEVGDITHFVSVKIDDTERRRAETELKRFTEELKRSNQALQDFTSIASHDLQEPLRKVMSFGDRLRHSLGDSLGEKEANYLDRMEQATQRMQNLIDDLLAYSRVTTRARPFTSLDLNGVINEVLADLSLRIEETGGRVEVDPLPTLEAEPIHMNVLFRNLIGNSLKFHRPGVPPVVKIASQKIESNLWEITISDNGIGFRQEDSERLFKPFERLRGKSEFPGTGMGTTICRKILDHHRGTITARGVPGQGSTFILKLPETQSP
ncbi:MAG: hypothetical protein COV67_00590 [Nitrospinae bacterium CG11_big_fil_rev_8_21_14_0_20_56_8]|nr:MAG: hypothetical protein COV67_00590 [Nitrospinae bacterium CG11_big_fil_rev_8_21_14_0_20_56_8]